MLFELRIHLHHCVCTFFLQETSGRTRHLLEHILLAGAVCSFSALILLHLQFLFYRGKDNYATQCLPSIPGFYPYANLTHLLLDPNGTS